jgi:hypothetical protein
MQKFKNKDTLNKYNIYVENNIFMENIIDQNQKFKIRLDDELQSL